MTHIGNDRAMGDAGDNPRGATQDVTELHRFGYRQQLRRSMGLYTSFSLAFAEIAITVTIFTLFAQPYETIGGVAVWIWIPVTLGGLLIATIWGHLVARMPVTGYAYQWSARIVNPHYGWFCGWTEFMGWLIGTAGIAVSAATVFSPYFWRSPTHHDIELLAAAAILLAVVVNIVSLQATAIVNNIGASAELFGTLGIALVIAVGLFFFHHIQGPHILFTVRPYKSSHVTLSLLALATLMPVYTILGWDASADLSEETKDARRVIPKAMRRAVIAGGVGGLFLFAIYSMAIRGSISHFLGEPGTPLVNVIQSHLGSGFTYVVLVILGFAMFSALLANAAAATRVGFALGRDKMLPFSGLWAHVSPKTRTPIFTVVIVGVIAELANVASAGIVERVIAGVSVAGFGIYAFVLIGVLWAHAKGRLPQGEPGLFDMGRWLVPGSIVALLYVALVMVMDTVPAVNHIDGEYFLYLEGIGVVWFVAVLGWKIRRGAAGPSTSGLAGDINAEESEVLKES